MFKKILSLLKPKKYMSNATCDIYKTNTEYIIHGYCADRNGLDLACEPVFHFPLSVNPNELLTNIRSVLASSGMILNNSENKEKENELLKLIGFNSWQALRKSSKLCSFQLKNDIYFITPMHKKGGGYMGKENDTIKISINEKSEEVISKLKNSFELLG